MPLFQLLWSSRGSHDPQVYLKTRERPILYNKKLNNYRCTVIGLVIEACGVAESFTVIVAPVITPTQGLQLAAFIESLQSM